MALAKETKPLERLTTFLTGYILLPPDEVPTLIYNLRFTTISRTKVRHHNAASAF